MSNKSHVPYEADMSRMNGRMKSETMTIVNGWMEVKSLQNDRSLLQKSHIKETIFCNDFLRQPQKATCSEQVACDAQTHTYVYIWGGYD
mmetsp:Transcript_49889/g.73311  ORF Transcript_49889/g.73311 Transcript_49889/m.73311 type:complete len:89 (+) Transcript_49889:884-1150(+)